MLIRISENINLGIEIVNLFVVAAEINRLKTIDYEIAYCTANMLLVS